MAQTTGAMNGSAAAVWLKVGVGAYVDYSGQSQSVDSSDIAIMTSRVYTFDGDFPIILAGKEEGSEVTINFLYTEVAAELWKTAYAAFKAKSAVQAKWEPKGTTGDQFETAAGGIIKNITTPEISADSADALIASITIEVPTITHSA
jgi:hypothetical protein